MGNTPERLERFEKLERLFLVLADSQLPRVERFEKLERLFLVLADCLAPRVLQPSFVCTHWPCQKLNLTNIPISFQIHKYFLKYVSINHLCQIIISMILNSYAGGRWLILLHNTVIGTAPVALARVLRADAIRAYALKDNVIVGYERSFSSLRGELF